MFFMAAFSWVFTNDFECFYRNKTSLGVKIIPA